MVIARLPPEEIDAALRGATLRGWALQDGKLHREYRFGSFVEAFGFMASVALVAESMNHHPEWFNAYGRVIVDLMTHEVGGISERDLQLAAQMEELASRQSPGQAG